MKVFRDPTGAPAVHPADLAVFPMPIAQLPALDLIDLNLKPGDWRPVVEQLFKGLQGNEAVTEADRAWQDLLERSSAGFTALHPDVALPHARTAAVTRLIFAVGRSLQGVSFGADAPAVRLVFLVLTPKEKPNEYLQMLAALSRRVRDASVRQALIAARDAAQFSAILEGPGT